ncbi:uncharacterized protein LOC108675006 [Hyalella azteca]|uniref:Uncharacterized protein LOC108675006 n=1 Tax=Hyalella azteca TaxID=294128 RepID=A0A8B7NXQ7_HYAAZ|nr:uncharacterized protein LOC108675006 [Hyalella azteca]
MSSPHVWMIGILLLLAVRTSSSSVGRQLSNDDFYKIRDSSSSDSKNVAYAEIIPKNITNPAPTRHLEMQRSTQHRKPNLIEEREIDVGSLEKSHVSRELTAGSINRNIISESSDEEAAYLYNSIVFNRSKRNYSHHGRSVYDHELKFNSGRSQAAFETGSLHLNIINEDVQDSIHYGSSFYRPYSSIDGIASNIRLLSFTLPRIKAYNHNIQSRFVEVDESRINLRNSYAGLPSRRHSSYKRRYPRFQRSPHQSRPSYSARLADVPFSQDPNYHRIQGVHSESRTFSQSSDLLTQINSHSQERQSDMHREPSYSQSIFPNSKINPVNNNYPSNSSLLAILDSQTYIPSLDSPKTPRARAYHEYQQLPNSSKRVIEEEARNSLNVIDNHEEGRFHNPNDIPAVRYQHSNFHEEANSLDVFPELTTVSAAVDDRLAYELAEDNDATSRSSKDPANLQVGKSLNIFSRYGFLTLSIKVRPPVGVHDYLFVENTAEVFQKNSYWSQRERKKHTGEFDDHFYIHFCENLNELLIAYFDHFTIEGVPKAHKAFTASLSARDLARQFGINSSFLRGRFSFVLVRLFRRKMRNTLDGPLTVLAALQAALRSVRIGSEESVHRFVDRFGTHVIKEFEVGDVMYQTFVFGERIYKQLKNTFVTVRSESHLEQLQLYFSPRYATSIGEIQLASGNSNLTKILENGGAVPPELLVYPNIFKAFDDPAVETELERLEGEVVLSLKLEKITTRLPQSATIRWMSEVLDNSLALYYHNLDSTRDTT